MWAETSGWEVGRGFGRSSRGWGESVTGGYVGRQCSLAAERFTTWGWSLLRQEAIPCFLHAEAFFVYAVKFQQKILLPLSPQF